MPNNLTERQLDILRAMHKHGLCIIHKRKWTFDGFGGDGFIHAADCYALIRRKLISTDGADADGQEDYFLTDAGREAIGVDAQAAHSETKKEQEQ